MYTVLVGTAERKGATWGDLSVDRKIISAWNGDTRGEAP